MYEEEFEIIDVRGLDKQSRECLYQWQKGGHAKLTLVFQWVLGIITTNMDTELLPVPAPILTRVFQELSNGKVHMDNALKIARTQFPFPYAQMTIVLLLLHSMFTPVVVCVYTGHWVVAGLFTFAATFVLWCIHFIAIEIEEPFGDDVNDLPLFEIQEDTNKSLIMLLEPETLRIPTLSDEAQLCLESLKTGRHLKSLNKADALRRAKSSRPMSLQEQSRVSVCSLQSARKSLLGVEEADSASPTLVTIAKNEDKFEASDMCPPGRGLCTESAKALNANQLQLHSPPPPNHPPEAQLGMLIDVDPSQEVLLQKLDAAPPKLPKLHLDSSCSGSGASPPCAELRIAGHPGAVSSLDGAMGRSGLDSYADPPIPGAIEIPGQTWSGDE